jgi:hypothetical protein
MSDYAQLYVRQSTEARLSPKQPDQPSLYLLSGYSIPVFWLALFTAADIVPTRLFPDEDYEWPHLVSPVSTALERLVERRAGSLAFSGSAEGARAWRPQLELMLDGFGEPLPVPRTRLMAKLRGDGLNEKWRALYVYGPGKLYEQELGRSIRLYCGLGGDRPAPWETTE